MAVTSKTLRSAQRTHGRTASLRRLFTALGYGVTLLLAVIALYMLVGVVANRLSIVADDVRYGRPRAFHLEGYVQHGDAPGRPTHLIALNMNRQVMIVELPGGDAAQARTLVGPYLFGANEDLTPITLSLRDMDGDRVDDLLVDVRQEQIVYLNRDGAFRLPTPDEQTHLLLEANK